MTETLLLKIVNGSTDINEVIKWLSWDEKDGFLKNSYKCTRTDFIAFFLNFIHEDLFCNYEQISQHKNNTLKQLEVKNDEIVVGREREGIVTNSVSKSTSFPLDKSFEKILNCSNQENKSLHSPKLTKVQSDSLLNVSYSSPLSPIYQKHTDILTANTEQVNTTKKSVLCLSDFIVSTPITKKKIKKGHLNNILGRRITPTCLKEKEDDCLRTSNCFDDFNIREVNSNSLSESRSFLVAERQKIVLKTKTSENNMAILSRKFKSTTNTREAAEVNRSFVSHKNAINNFVKVYIALLNNSLILNITTEIYFLISLLTRKEFHFTENRSADLQPCCFLLTENFQNGIDTTIKSCLHLFRSIHNYTYFAVKSLESQINVLKYYDKTTLLLLSENYRLNTVSKPFSEQLKKISGMKCDRLLELSYDIQHTNVCFKLDTDNRDNFPSDLTFHSFRKQRDLFYEILRIWELNHLQSGWSFSVGLGGKIKSLINLHRDPTNFVHFCRLFKEQLLSTCGKSHKDDISEDDFSFLSSLPNVNTDKLSRLKNRLVTKESSRGLNTVPSFMGYEEFYKEFILVASNYIFNKHLCDALIMEIIELNNTKFTFNDYQDSDVDVSTKKSFTICIKYLKIMAKFLGFVESLPYRSDFNSYTENLVSSHLNIRQKVTPSLDVKQLIISAIEQHHAILTIPWLTEYLAMLDFSTLRLSYYISVYKVLFQLYRTYNQDIKHDSYNNALIRFSLGWLFELPHFPDSEFFTYLSETEITMTNFKKKANKVRTLDDLEIVDQNMLYIFCPYLEEIKKLLTDVSNSQTKVKHITPVTAIQSGQEISRRKMEQQLEDAFFNGQPVSVRKTVEFVSERVASACVKQICHDVVPDFKQTSLKELDNMLKVLHENGGISKQCLGIKVSDMAMSYLTCLKEQCAKSTYDIIKEKIPTCIESLLAIDTLTQTKTTCVSITVRMCKDRVKQWTNSHLNLSIFMKDFNLELSRREKEESKRITKTKPLFALPSTGNKEKHDDTCFSAATLLEIIKNLSITVLDRPSIIKEESILGILNKSFATLTERCDVNENINSYICMVLVDFLLLLVVHRPDLSEREDILKYFVKVWNEFFAKTEDLFKNLLCPRNIMLMRQSDNNELVWSNLAKLVAFLIKANVLSSDNFEFQCTAFYQKEWDQVTLENMSVFLNKFVEIYKKDGGNMDKFTFLLEFLSDFCLDM